MLRAICGYTTYNGDHTHAGAHTAMSAIPHSTISAFIATLINQAICTSAHTEEEEAGFDISPLGCWDAGSTLL